MIERSLNGERGREGSAHAWSVGSDCLKRREGSGSIGFLGKNECVLGEGDKSVMKVFLV